MTRVRLSPHPLLPPILTGKSENDPVAKAADGAEVGAGLLAEIETSVKTGRGAKIQDSNGRRSDVMRTTLGGSAMQEHSEGIATTIGRSHDPALHLLETDRREEMRGDLTEIMNDPSDREMTKREKRRGRRRRGNLHPQYPNNL